MKDSEKTLDGNIRRILESIRQADPHQRLKLIHELRKEYPGLFSAAAIHSTSLIRNTRDIIYHTDLEGRLTFVSDSFQDLSGYSIEEALGRKTDEGFYRNPRERETFLKELKDRGYVTDFEAELVRRDGSSWWVSTNAHYLRDDAGKIVGVEGISRDITAIKAAREALEDSEKKYRDLFEKSRDAILIIEDEKFVDCNRATVEMLGYPRKEDLLQTHPSQLSPEVQPDGRGSQEKADEMMRVAMEKGTHRFEWNHRKYNGEVFPVEVLLTPISKDRGKQIIHTVWRDITDRKAAEKALIESRRLGAIGEMASAVAHDFNNSLQAILGNLELLRRHTDLPRSALRYLEVIRSSASDARTRVQLLQRFGGKKEKESPYRLLDVTRIIRDVLLQLKPLIVDRIQERGHRIHIKTEPTSGVTVRGNREELSVVLYNVLKNALEAIDGNGEIEIHTGHKEGDAWVLIRDSGRGMDPETAGKVFDPFFSTKDPETGRGFGLSGAHRIVEEHGGSIRVKETRPGAGTSVEIRFPRSSETDTPDEDRTEGNRRFPGLRVLWVDDEKGIRDILIEYLEELEAEGDVVSSGQRALEYLENHPVDLVITDIGMPGMNGWELTDRIHERFGGKPKVAAVSGWGTQITEEERETHGLVDVLSKPVTIRDVERLFRRHFLSREVEVEG